MGFKPFTSSILSILTFTLCFAGIFANPTHPTLQSVFGFFRHGVRSPPMKSILTEQQQRQLESMSTGVLGSLTSVGKKEMYAVGVTLQERYGAFIGGYHDAKVKVTSTSSSRTLMSALSVTAGMFSPSTRLYRTLAWQPVPVSQNIHDMDKSFIYLTPNFQDYANKVCPAYGKLIAEGFGELKGPDERIENRKIYNLLSQYTNTPINSVLDLAATYDTLYMLERNGMELPGWASAPQAELQNRPLYPDIMVPFLRELLDNVQYYHGNQLMLTLFSGPIFYAVTKQFRKFTLESSAEKMWLHFTHDCTLYSILRGLKVTEPSCPHPGDGVIFELHDHGGRKTVKMFYFDAKQNEIKGIHSPLCPDDCPLDTFHSNLHTLSPQQWSELCHREEQTSYKK